MTSRMDLNESIAFFFCDTKKAPLFFKALYGNGNYYEPPNTEQNPDIKGTQLEMMLAKHYVDYNDTKYNITDIHPDFINFIVNTAHYHSYLDKPLNIRNFIEKLFEKNAEKLKNQQTFSDTVSEIINSAIQNYKISRHQEQLQSPTASSSSIQSTASETQQGGLYTEKELTDLKMRIDELVVFDANGKNFQQSISLISDFISKHAEHNAVLENKISYNFCEKVLVNWDKLDPHARDFYKAQLSVFRRDRLTENWEDKNLLENDTFIWENFLKQGLEVCSKHIRINLKKSPDGKSTMFAHTLPFIPKNLTRVIENNENNEKKYSHQLIDDVLFLKNLYMDEYLKNTQVHDMNCSESKNWNLNIPNLVKYLLVNFPKSQEMSSQMVPQDIDQIVNVVDDKTIYRDAKKGLYRYDKGQKNYVNDQDASNTNTCTYTGLNKKLDIKTCYNVANCLLNSPEKLMECLNSYIDPNDLFQVSQEELENMNPHVAEKLLSLFCVKGETYDTVDNYGNNIKLVQPISFRRWYEELVDSSYMPKHWTHEFKQLIKNNTQIQNYISGIINFVKKNPSILNKDYIDQDTNTNTIDDDKLTEIMNKTKNQLPLEIGYYTDPYYSTGRTDSKKNLLLTNINLMQNTHGALGVFGGTPMLSSATMMLPLFGGQLPIMSGGDGSQLKSKCSLIKQMQNQLEVDGIQFTQEQKELIDKTCKSIEKQDKAINSIAESLEMMNQLLGFVKSSFGSNTPKTVTNRVLDLKEITDSKDMMNWLVANIRDSRMNIDSRITRSNEAISYIISKFNEILKKATISK